MKTIKYWKFQWDNGTSYGNLKGNFSNLKILKRSLEKSEAVFNQLSSRQNYDGYWVNSKDIKEIKIEVKQIDETAEIIMYAVGLIKINKKIGETKEIKEEGKPYIPAQPIYEKVEIDLSTKKLKVYAYLKDFKLDGIPDNYGEVK